MTNIFRNSILIELFFIANIRILIFHVIKRFRKSMNGLGRGKARIFGILNKFKEK